MVLFFLHVHIHSYSHRWSPFADSLHPLHVVTSYDSVTLGSALFLSLVAKPEAMNTFGVEGRVCSLLRNVVVVVVDMEFCGGGMD